MEGEGPLVILSYDFSGLYRPGAGTNFFYLASKSANLMTLALDIKNLGFFNWVETKDLSTS